MIGAGTYVAILLLAAIPPWSQPSALVTVLSLVAGALLVFGVRQPLLLAAAGSAALACAAYALALWSAAAPAGIVEPLAFGIALLMALRRADFARSFQGVEVPPAIARDAVNRGLVTAGLSVASVLVLIGAVTLLADGAPPAWRPVLAGAGAFLALAAAVAVLGRARPQ